jgi:hypothetical protein
VAGDQHCGEGAPTWTGTSNSTCWPFVAWSSRPARANTEATIEVPFARYQEATGLWRGEPLADLAALSVHPATAALARERQAVILEYADAARALGRHEPVIAFLLELADADPLHEAVLARLMIALAGSGRRAEALAVFDGLRSRLVGELGIDPGPELRELHHTLLRDDVGPAQVPATAAPRPPREPTHDPVPALTEPGAAERTERWQPGVPAQLPADVAGFTCRDDELARLDALLPLPPGTTSPVISAISGTAGVGKTTLAERLRRP